MILLFSNFWGPTVFSWGPSSQKAIFILKIQNRCENILRQTVSELAPQISPGYPRVPQSTLEYPEAITVPWSTLPKVPWRILEYPEVPQSIQLQLYTLYPRVSQSSLGSLEHVHGTFLIMFCTHAKSTHQIQGCLQHPMNLYAGKYIHIYIYIYIYMITVI